MEQSKPEPKRHLCELAEATLKGLQAKGIEPTFEEVCWINDLARRIEKPSGGENRHLAGRPRRAGSVWLWPPTIQSDMWWEMSLDWFTEDPELERYALAYSLAHARTPGAFDGLQGYQSARSAIKDWRKTLNCTQCELAEAIAEVMQSDTEMDAIDKWYRRKGGEPLPTPAAPSWDGLVAHLEACTGLQSDVWFCGESKDMVFKVLDAINAQQMAMAGGRDGAPDPHDPYIIASRDLGLAQRWIIESRKEQADNGKQVC